MGHSILHSDAMTSFTLPIDHEQATLIGRIWQPQLGATLVAITAEQETPFDGPETFSLVASNTGGGIAEGTATIKDDGTGELGEYVDQVPNHFLFANAYSRLAEIIGGRVVRVPFASARIETRKPRRGGV